MKRFVTWVLFLVFGGGIAFGAPLDQVEMQRDNWVRSGVGVEFTTSSGLPEIGTYAVMHDGYWVGASNDTYQIEYYGWEREDEALARIADEKLTEIQPTGKKLYFSEYEYKGKIYAKYGTGKSLADEYGKLSEPGTFTPTHKIRQSLLESTIDEADAALAKDNQELNGCGGTSSCSKSFTTSGTDRYLIVMTFHRGQALTSVTHNGNTLTERASVSDGDGTMHHHAYAAPDTSGNLVATLDGASAAFRWHAQSYTGADQTDDNGADGTNTAASATEITCTQTATTDDHFTWMSARGANNQTDTVDTPGYALDSFFSSTGVPEVEATSATSSGTESVTVSNYSSTDIKCIISEIAPVAGAAPEPIKRQSEFFF